MIEGIIRDDEAILRLTVIGPGGLSTDIEAAIDTGFNGGLTLPGSTIAAIQLVVEDEIEAELGDGSHCVFKRHHGFVNWDGEIRETAIDQSESMPVVGMRLLRGYELKMQVRRRGKVTIRKLARK